MRKTILLLISIIAIGAFTTSCTDSKEQERVALEAKIKADIAESLEFFNKYNDFSQMERATFLALARSVIKLIALKIIYCSDALVGECWAEVQNLIFATDLMICERDGKSKRSLVDIV